jgi:hypothetical protein
MAPAGEGGDVDGGSLDGTTMNDADGQLDARERRCIYSRLLCRDMVTRRLGIIRVTFFLQQKRLFWVQTFRESYLAAPSYTDGCGPLFPDAIFYGTRRY